jgi:hypothetical protein
MPRPALEVADIFRSHGAAWRKANAGHLSLGQLKAMAAIEACRTAALGGHVAACEDCGHTVISYALAATGTARSAKEQRLASGLPTARPSFCRCLTITSSSHAVGHRRYRMAEQGHRLWPSVQGGVGDHAVLTLLSIIPVQIDSRNDPFGAHDSVRPGSRCSWNLS